MQKNTKEAIKRILENQSKIPGLFWRERDVLWLQENPRFGVKRNSQLVWVDGTSTNETNWQNFFRKAKIKINQRL